jgi:CRP-like cAMP-binding protein/RsiW-degrading membrane proteinase PrsW (M82 family)
MAFPAGARILREGDASDEAYFILRGKAAIGTNNLIGQQVVLAVLGPGETFGEGGLVTGAPRTATVAALTQVETYCISRETFEWLAAEDPDFPRRALNHFDVLQLDRFLKRASPFAHLSRPALKRLLPELETRRAAPGQVIIREDEAGDEFFLVRSGEVEVVRRGKLLATLGAGDFFGEVALLTAAPRTATVRATEETSLLVLSRPIFQAIVSEERSVGDQIREMVAIRFGGAPSQSVMLPDPVSTFIPFAGDAPRRNLWALMAGGALTFALLAVLAAVTEQPLFVYGALLCGALVAPTLFLTYLARAKLLAERPSGLIATCLFAAGAGLPLAIFIEHLLGATPGQLTSALAVSIIEELAKIIGVIWLLNRRPLRFRMDGIIFGAAAGMGFAAIENALYAGARLDAVDEMVAVLFLRSVLAPFGHGAWTALVCAAIWREKGAHAARPSWQVVAAFSVAVLLHTMWDWRPLPNVLNLFWVFGMATAGVVILRAVLHDALREETRSVSALNPGATGALGPRLRVLCGACGQQAPSGVRYCPRCGAALRVVAV